MEQHQQAAQSVRTGQMTAVMRAVTQAVGPKILRIGVVQSGRVVDERLIKERSHVTIGPSERAMFVVPSRKLPSSFKLFELISGDYYLNYMDGMEGRVALKTGISDLNELKAQAKPATVAGAKVHRIKLTDDSRGKIVVGETTFLFQFVVPPPVQPRPQLPVSVRRGLAGDIDWFTTIVAAFSFLLHFFFVALVYSDWMDPPVDDEVIVSQLTESFERLPPPPVVERPKAQVDVEATAAATAEADAPKAPTAGKGSGTGKGASGVQGAGAGKGSGDTKAAEIASELAELNTALIGSMGEGGVATEGVYGGGELPSDLLDDVGRSAAGAGRGGQGGLNLDGATGGGRVRPGSGGGGRGLKDIGEKGASSTGGGKGATGEAKKVEGPKGSAMVGGAGVSGGAVANASSVVARMRGRFRRCYLNGLQQNPEMQGSVTLTARIGPNGEVLGVGGGGGGSIGPIVGCLKAVVGGATFSPPDGGGAVVTIPISFVRQ